MRDGAAEGCGKGGWQTPKPRPPRGDRRLPRRSSGRCVHDSGLPSSTHATVNKKRIPSVDEEVPLTRLLKLSLEQAGMYTVEVENRSEQAVRTAERLLPELVLMEVMMPGIDGGTLAGQFQSSERLKAVPIVFLTAAELNRKAKRRPSGKHVVLVRPGMVHSPNFPNRSATSFRWKSREQRFSSSPGWKWRATAGSALSCARKSASSRPACFTSQVFMAASCASL